MGPFLRERRRNAGLSEQDACDYLERISLDELRHFEEGTKSMPVWVIYGLANYLNIAPHEIQARLVERDFQDKDSGA